MRLKEKISIDDFDLQSKDADVYSQNIKKAVITHFIHNRKNGIKQYFEKDAEKYLNEFLSQIKPDLYEGKITKKDLERQLFLEVENVPFPNDAFYTFKFIDLFAGIGGFRMAMQNLGGKSVFSSEWDKYSQITYKANFGEVPFGDITKEETKKHIPCGFDILCAGFPCQAFSIAGRRGGFEDKKSPRKMLAL